ncbi:mismatch repair endonuclease PMS2-like [Glandiceps talaboti]
MDAPKDNENENAVPSLDDSRSEEAQGDTYTEMLAGHVQAIDKRSVHQICSGQVVLNLATAVKELVENSLDAGATNVDVRLKEHGAELLEVVDNGSGVHPSDFKGLALKHHTSKLRDFSDLTSVGTFGFRGEALSSLCALSNLTVTTCHRSTQIGSKIQYDHNGEIIKQEACPRQQGTTVSLQQVFSTLPVRHKEFLRNLKKEYTKMVNVLYAYCIISTNVRIHCSNHNEKGKKSVVVSTSGNSSIKENITNVFGPKQLQSILDFEQHPVTESVCEEYGLKYGQVNNDIFRVTGLVSKPDHGLGRSSTDRQFYFINNRPCDISKVSKLVNEVYHTYNRHQYPFVVMDISLAQDGVDVNVTPDKRQIFLQEEKTLLAIIKCSLTRIFEPRSSVYQVNQKAKTMMTSMSAMFARQSSGNVTLQKTASEPAIKTLTLSRLKRAFSHPTCISNNDDTERVEKPAKQPRLDNFLMKSTTLGSSKETQYTDKEGFRSDSTTTTSFSKKKAEDNVQIQTDSKSDSQTPTLSCTHTGIEYPTLENIQKNSACLDENTDNKDNKSVLEITFIERTDSKTSDKTQDRMNDDETVVGRDSDLQHINDSTKKVNLHLKPEGKYGAKESQTECKTDKEIEIQRKEVVLPFSLSRLQNKLEQNKGDQTKELIGRSFHAGITPVDNTAAEEELEREISKDMFTEMEILGQFNLGFIIAKLNQDLFIIDQHATDEKYNFEMLQKHTKLQSQRLIQPQQLALTSVNETILIDNLEIFRKNGFDFVIDEDGEPTKRIQLVSLPISKNWTFGKDDIDELIFMLSDAPGITCRPSRVRQMFASRACRSSIMIGTALNTEEMKKLVGHMADLQQPWNCPHGRPTMRHLFNLNMLPD